MTDRLKKLADLLNEYGIEVIDITPRLYTKGRDSEILSWLADNHSKVESYVVIDDERSDLECFVRVNRLVQTSSVPEGEMIKGLWYENTGLKRKHVKQAIEILNYHIGLHT